MNYSDRLFAEAIERERMDSYTAELLARLDAYSFDSVEFEDTLLELRDTNFDVYCDYIAEH